MGRRLGADEHVIFVTRTHGKALVLPAVSLVVISGAAGFGIAVLPDGAAHEVLQWAVIGVACLLILWMALRPFLRWLTSTYTVTNRRLISRSGVLRRVGRDIPLHRVSDVTYERSLLDRLLGCGTLVVADASEHGRSVLTDVPEIKRLHRLLVDLLFGSTPAAEERRVRQ